MNKIQNTKHIKGTNHAYSLLITNWWFITKCDKKYYKVRQLLQVLQTATIYFITKCVKFLLQTATGTFITKCDKKYYKVRQLLKLLQSVTIFITKCDSFSKILQSATVLQSETLHRSSILHLFSVIRLFISQIDSWIIFMDVANFS